MHWGKSIAVVMILFIGYILTLVYTTFTRDADLISDTYYEEELEYDLTKDKKSNYLALEEQIKIDQAPDGIHIIFPSSYDKPIEGKIHFYRHDLEKYDRKFELDLTDNQQVFDYELFVEGAYEVRVEWKDAHKSYLCLQDINF